MSNPAIFHSRNHAHRFDKDPNYERILRGAYQRRNDRRAGTDPISLHITKIMAAHSKIPHDSLFSHTTAARLYGFSLPPKYQDIHIYQRFPRGGENSSEIVRHTATRGTVGSRLAQGLNVVEPLRTIIDCIRMLPIGDAFVLADSAAAQLCKANRFERVETLMRWRKVQSALKTELNQIGSIRGIRQARAVVHYMSPFSDSPPESRLRLLCLQLNLPNPQVQPLLMLEGRRIFPDQFWEKEDPPTVAEFDGAIKYATTDGFGTEETLYQEKIREDRLRRAGIEVVRFTHQDLHLHSAPMLQLLRLVQPEARPHELKRYLR